MPQRLTAAVRIHNPEAVECEWRYDNMKLPEIGDIYAAAERLAGQHAVTPLVSNPVLDEMLGARVLFKAECLQRTGSFKFRGAFNALKLKF